MSFDAKKTFGKTKTIAEQLKGKSTLVSQLNLTEVYKYFNLWVGNSGFATSKNIENPVVCFKVEKVWIKNNNINQSLVTLQWYDKGWEPLYTEKVKEDNNYVYFKSKTPVFSFFAITGISKGNSKKETEKLVSEISLSSSPNSSILVGQSVTLTAIVNASSKGTENLSGTVTFMDGDSPIGTKSLSSGQANLTTPPLSVGSHSITAEYSGNDKFETSTASIVIPVQKLSNLQKLLLYSVIFAASILFVILVLILFGKIKYSTILKPIRAYIIFPVKNPFNHQKIIIIFAIIVTTSILLTSLLILIGTIEYSTVLSFIQNNLISLFIFIIAPVVVDIISDEIKKRRHSS